MRMPKPRIPETEGVTGELTVHQYDALMRRLRDKGYLPTNAILEAGISAGDCLEIGPGPGYLGLEWLDKTAGTRLTGLDLSTDMLAVANENARQYGVQERVTYVEGRAQRMPFSSGRFDGVFSNGSLHEWTEPEAVFNEIDRVLKPGGRFFISDLRRDMNPAIRWFLKLNIKPKERRAGFLSSVAASYTPQEAENLLARSNLHDAQVLRRRMVLVVAGVKDGAGQGRAVGVLK
jgi:ubiquinone/menaquinone biosynthesis C-methylase UbiE